MQAVVLAGQRNNGRLEAAAPVEYEALIPIAGRPMVEYVVRALAGHPRVDSVRVVGPSSGEIPVVPIVPGASLWENIDRGLEGLDPDVSVLVATADIPLLTTAVVEAFLTAADTHAEIVYPLIPEAVLKSRFPTAQRTYFRFREGVYTGGNLFLVKARVTAGLAVSGPRLLEHRKSPLRLAQDVGTGVLIKFLLGRLSISDVEKQAGRLLGVDGRALVLAHPEVGMDVDKPADLVLVEEALVHAKERGEDRA